MPSTQRSNTRDSLTAKFMKENYWFFYRMAAQVHAMIGSGASIALILSYVCKPDFDTVLISGLLLLIGLTLAGLVCSSYVDFKYQMVSLKVETPCEPSIWKGAAAKAMEQPWQRCFLLSAFIAALLLLVALAAVIALVIIRS